MKMVSKFAAFSIYKDQVQHNLSVLITSSIPFQDTSPAKMAGGKYV